MNELNWIAVVFTSRTGRSITDRWGAIRADGEHHQKVATKWNGSNCQVGSESGGEFGVWEDWEVSWRSQNSSFENFEWEELWCSTAAGCPLTFSWRW